MEGEPVCCNLAILFLLVALLLLLSPISPSLSPAPPRHLPLPRHLLLLSPPMHRSRPLHSVTHVPLDAAAAAAHSPTHSTSPTNRVNQGILSEKKELNSKLKELEAVRKTEKNMSQKVSKAEAKVSRTHFTVFPPHTCVLCVSPFSSLPSISRVVLSWPSLWWFQEPQHKVEQRMLELEQAKKKTAEVSQEAAQKLLEVQQDKHQTLRTG